jgi:polysaccharide export outer membrane protein
LAAVAPGGDAKGLARLGPGDSVAIQVYGQPDMSTTLYVGDDGTIRVPLAGAVQVAGTTPVEAGERVEKALKEGGYFVDPHVTLSLVQSRSQRVSVLGEVKQPGSYAIDPTTSVFDVLAEAGGVTDNGADIGYVRRRDAGGHIHSYSVDLRGLADSKDGLPNQRLDGGDEIYVPQAEHVYVYGEVTNPNMYKLEPGMTVMQAIVRAGGITPRGSERRVVIKRVGKDGKYIITSAKPSELVQPDDVIRVKESIF